MANQFNNHFTTIASRIDQKIIKTKRKFQEYLANLNSKTFSLYPTTPTEVRDYIKNLDIRKSVGPLKTYFPFQLARYLICHLKVEYFHKK